jgi:hypothetical protein
MTKGHNQDRNKSTKPEAKHQPSQGQGQNRSLSDQKKDKSPNQGRNAEKDQSGGTKGQNAI